MKKIFVLSIQHTGTYFASATIAAAYDKKHQLRIGSLWDKHKKLKHTRFVDTGPIEISDFTKPAETVNDSWFDQAVTSVCTPEDLANKKIIVGHEHHHKAKSWLIAALSKAPAKVPIIIPMRDPLLSLHSKLWREDEQHNNPNETDNKARVRRLKSWIARYIEILSIPKEHIFLLPIDAQQSKTESGRLQLIQDMYSYCKVPFNEKAEIAALAWAPANKTFNLITRLQEKVPKPQWEHFKKQYLERDIQHTKAFMSLEFDELRKQDRLKRLMEKAGYQDVLWW